MTDTPLACHIQSAQPGPRWQALAAGPNPGYGYSGLSAASEQSAAALRRLGARAPGGFAASGGLGQEDPAVTFANIEQAEFWSQLAPVWLELEDRLEEVSGLPGHLAMDRLELLPGQRVVDLGCGSGRTTLELASRVGPGGQVTGADITAELLARARERAALLAVGNVEFVHADVQVHDLGEARFDAAYSRFGVMFFTDPVAAFANVRRALRPGGVLSFVCWQSVFDNEWMLIPGAAVATVTGSLPPMPGPDEPGPFSLADPGRVRAVLDAAGFDRVAIAPHADQVVISEARIPEVALTSTRVGGVREALRDAGQETRDRALAAIEEALRARLEDGQVRASRGVLLVTGRA
jgi:SAM-dependent methyltransferase